MYDDQGRDSETNTHGDGKGLVVSQCVFDNDDDDMHTTTTWLQEAIAEWKIQPHTRRAESSCSLTVH
jgi:hypothetical protein